MRFNPLACRWAGVNFSNIGFHAPPQQPAGHTMARWETLATAAHRGMLTRLTGSITWSTETFATNQNANAIRWGTLYNFRFDADQPPQTANATVGFFKTGSPMTVAIQVPGGGGGTPTPTPTVSPTSTPSPTVTPTPSATPTATPRPTPTPRPNPPPQGSPNAASAPVRGWGLLFGKS